MLKIVNIEVLKGQKFDEVVSRPNSEEVHFIRDDQIVYVMRHLQSCCENVYLEDIDTSLDVLTNAVIYEAEVVTEDSSPPIGDYVDSYTWTFYKFRTEKGHVTLRWYGESNGYYSEDVDLIEM